MTNSAKNREEYEKYQGGGVIFLDGHYIYLWRNGITHIITVTQSMIILKFLSYINIELEPMSF